MSRIVKFFLEKKTEILKISLLLLLILVSSYEKYKVFDESGGDLEIYRNTVRSFLKGENPYEYTVKSFTFLYDEYGNELAHGYAYLPTLMYVQAPLYKLSESTGLPLQRVWKIPLLAADIGVAILLIFLLYRKNYLATLFAVGIWSYHPFFYQIHSYTNWEPFPVFFLLLALLFLGKKDFLSGLFYAVAFSFKTFPIILFPLFLIKSKNKFKFLIAGAFLALFISIPFMKSGEDFSQYINGSLLVHGERELQGRPILSYLTYYTPLNFGQVGFTKIYAYLAIFAPWVITGWLIFKKGISNKYLLAGMSFLTYYLLTPVLNRTHLIWGIPFFILAVFEATKEKKWLFYSILGLFYVFYAWYLGQWFRGFRFDGNIISL